MRKILNKIRKGLSNPLLVFSYLIGKPWSRILPDRLYIKLRFLLTFHCSLNLKKVKTFNEKLQWLKLYDRNPRYTDLVDKYAVREYIKNTIGEEYLVRLLGVYNTAEEIDYSKLPNQFVLKPTHTSGDVIICRDKMLLDVDETTKKLNKWLKREYYWVSREWPYKNIKPRIICEELLVDESGHIPKDYKVFCFNGEPKIIQVDFDRFINHKRNLYSVEWEYLDFEIGYPSDRSVDINKPICLEEILILSRKLSKGYPHVRVDFYIIGTTIFFGELTFYHGSGFEKFTPESYDYLLGSWIDLSLVEKNQKEDDDVRKVK